jgi:hypothetical protein
VEEVIGSSTKLLESKRLDHPVRAQVPSDLAHRAASARRQPQDESGVVFLRDLYVGHAILYGPLMCELL